MKWSQIVYKNKQLFAKNTLTEDDICKLGNIKKQTSFKNAKEVTRYNLKKLGVYSNLNKVLADYGLVIKARDYYTKFDIIRNEKDLNKEADRLERYAKGALSRSYTITHPRGSFTL